MVIMCSLIGTISALEKTSFRPLVVLNTISNHALSTNLVRILSGPSLIVSRLIQWPAKLCLSFATILSLPGTLFIRIFVRHVTK